MEDWKAISVLDRAKKGYDYNDDVRTAMDRAIEALYFEMRARELFDAVIDLLVKQRESDVVLNLLTETVHYDEEECDGYCLMLLGLVSGPGKLYRFLKGRRLIVDKVQRAFSVTKNVLCGVRRVAATQKHCIVILARYVVRLNQGIRSKVSLAILAKRRDNDGGHREKQRCLIKVIYYS